VTLPVRISFILTVLFSLATLVCVVYAVGWAAREELGASLVTWSTVPLFGALAVGPYVLAHRCARRALNVLWGWIYVAGSVVVACMALPIYREAFPASGAQISPNVVFVLMPGCQLIILGVIMATEHLWRRQQPQADDTSDDA